MAYLILFYFILFKLVIFGRMLQRHYIWNSSNKTWNKILNNNII